MVQNVPEEGAHGAITRALARIRRGDYAGAIRLLNEGANGDAGSHGLRGIASFLSRDYDLAAEEFARAAARASTPEERDDWLRRERLARANAEAALDATRPSHPFDAATILAAPATRNGDLPEPLAPPDARPGDAVYAAIGAVLGTAIEHIWRGVGPLAKLLRRRSTSIWTDWDEKPLYPGLVQLASIREQLEENNLFDAYPAGAHTAFQRESVPIPDGVRSFRTADGSWNDPGNPREGSANVRFPRNVRPEAGLPESLPRLDDPNPALISERLLGRGEDGMKPIPFLNLHAAAWIQFMVHDWVSHRTYAPNDGEANTLSIELPREHSLRTAYHLESQRVGRTMPDPTRRAADGDAPPSAINEVTSWWDGSQLYGSDAQTTRSLRSFVDGKLLLPNDRLPVEDRVEQTGYNRNWWLGLSLMHTLFAREHNAICDELKRHYPEWDDERLFNVARLVNAAVMAKIHTVEWTPAILPNPTAKVALESNWYGLVENRLFRKERKVLRRFKIRQAVFGGLVGNPIEKRGVPYGLSEEFVEVYRLHEVLPDTVDIRDLNDPSRDGTLTLPELRGRATARLVEQHPMANLLYSFGTQHPGQIVLHNYPASMRELAVAGAAALDLAAVDILRARERGVPRYNEFRRQLGLKPIRRFRDLTSNEADIATLHEVYRGDVEAIDLLVGTRAEAQEHRPDGFGFGETLFQIFILNASRRLQADYFFTDGYNAANYTQAGLDWIDRATFKSVLLRHCQELSQTGLSNVNNAFEPWDTDPEHAPLEHPLELMDRPGRVQRVFEGGMRAASRATAAVSEIGDLADAAFTRLRAVFPWKASLYDPLPPGSFGLPLLGESLSFIRSPGPFLEDRFKKHGSIFKTHLAFRPTVCFGGQSAYPLFLDEQHFSRVNGAPVTVRKMFNPKSLSFMDGPQQRRVQSHLLNAFNDVSLARYLPRLDSLISARIAAWERSATFAWVPELEDLSFSIIDGTFMGAPSTVTKSVSVELFDRLTRGVVKSPFSPELYIALAVRLLFVNYAKRVIARRKQVPGNDVVSELLRPRREGALEFLSDDELCIELVHFFLAGAPLQAALAYHLLHLAQYPDVTAAARAEVERVWPQGDADLDRIHALTYVLKTCKESRRLARLVPNTFFGVVKNDLEIQGYRIPKGWKAMGLIGSTHHDPGTFPNPETYDPGRFDGQCPMYVAHGGDLDPHHCIGERFADLVMTLLTARLLQTYTWDLVPGQDLGPRTGKVAPVPAGGLQVVFRRFSPTR